MWVSDDGHETAPRPLLPTAHVLIGLGLFQLEAARRRKSRGRSSSRRQIFGAPWLEKKRRPPCGCALGLLGWLAGLFELVCASCGRAGAPVGGVGCWPSNNDARACESQERPHLGGTRPNVLFRQTLTPKGAALLTHTHADRHRPITLPLDAPPCARCSSSTPRPSSWPSPRLRGYVKPKQTTPTAQARPLRCAGATRGRRTHGNAIDPVTHHPSTGRPPRPPGRHPGRPDHRRRCRHRCRHCCRRRCHHRHRSRRHQR